MLIHRIPALDRLLAIAPHALELILAEDGKARLRLLLPPLEDLREIRALSTGNISVSHDAAKLQARMAENFAEQLSVLLAKRERFQASPTFATHVANLAELAGDYQKEHEVLLEAETVTGMPFFRHRRGVNLIAQGLEGPAEEIFKSLDLEVDVGANLRLAYLYVCKQNFQEAKNLVDRALRIDPIDFSARLFQGSLALAQGNARLAVNSFRIAADERETASLYTNLAIAHVVLKQADKALRALRRAVALEPFNENSVAMLADLTFSEGRSKEAVLALERFLEFEQKSASMWARYARALIECGENAKALEALKRQASIEESSSVFNNLGVVFGRVGDKKRAAEYYAFAMRNATEGDHEYLLASRNLLSAFAEAGRFGDLIAIGKDLIKIDAEGNAARDKALSDIYALFVYGVARHSGRRAADYLAERFLRDIPDANPRLRVWLSGGLLGSWAMRHENWPAASKLAEEALAISQQLDVDDARRRALKNNVAFLFIEMGRFHEAARLLSEIGKWIHKEPYPTATLGLLQMRKGRMEKGEALYKEAIRLARTPHDKARLSQKMHLELGRVLMDVNVNSARRHLGRAIKDFNAEDDIRKEAESLLKALPKPAS